MDDQLSSTSLPIPIEEFKGGQEKGLCNFPKQSALCMISVPSNRSGLRGGHLAVRQEVAQGLDPSSAPAVEWEWG